MMQFVFCHGFGFDIHFWDHLVPYFSQKNCSFIDLGYFKCPASPLNFQEQTIIGIGHSLGLLKLISMYENFNYLIGLNSFVNFLGNDQTLHGIRYRELTALKQSFTKNPVQTLKNFYKRCGVRQFVNQRMTSHLDLNLILSDLEFLKKDYALPPIPTLILTSNDDSVVPKEIIEDNFLRPSSPQVQVDIIPNTQHGLGFKKPLEVYEKIMGFLNDKVI